MKLRTLVALFLSVAIPMPAFAQPHAIAELGNAPLVGPIASTNDLQSDVIRDDARFRAAAVKLGLTPEEYAKFLGRVSSRQVSYVTIPRRVDAMSWSSGGSVYVLHDVILPQNTHGWEIDLQEGHRLLALFVPARCGNLSLLRKPLPVLAQSPGHRVAVSAAATAPAAAQPPPAAPQSAPAAPVVQLPPAAPAAAPAVQSVAVATPPAHSHRLGFMPLLLLVPLVAIFASHGGSTPGVPLVGGRPPLPPPGSGAPPPPGSGAPPPPPAGCPSPAPATR